MESNVAPAAIPNAHVILESTLKKAIENNPIKADRRNMLML